MAEAPSALSRLSRSELWSRERSAAFREIVEVAAEALAVARVGIWLYESERRTALRCAATCVDGTSRDGDARLTATQYPRYFAALEQERAIAAHDARADPSTAELTEGYMDVLGIGAMLDAPIVVRGRSVGVVCHEHVGGSRRWTEREQLTAASIADFVALVIVSEEERAARRQLGLTLAAAKVGTWSWSIRDARWTWSPELGPIVGLPWNHQPSSPEEYLRIVHPDDLGALTGPLADRLPESGFSFTDEHRIVLPGGETRWIATRAELYRDPEGRPERMVGSVMDVTERRLLEARRLERGRIEDLGRLAAGVAHDFNNLLTVIMMGAEVAGSGRPADVDAGLRFVQDAAQRAKALTGRMLSFSRARPPARVVCRVDEVVPGFLGMLKRLFPDGVRLQDAWADDLPPVRADPSELEQVVMNLILNARDAVGEEGTVTLEVDTCTLGAAEAGGTRLPGRYVRLRVRDDGTGIHPDDLARVFDPLFTTKALGKGTGIGLSTSQRIVRDAGGDISVRTELGVGTEFTVLLPAVSDAGRSIDPPREDGGPGPRRRVAVQISDPLMRELVVRVLEGAGHPCFVAHDGDELARRRAQVGALDLVVLRGRCSPEQRGGITATSGAPLLLLGGADPDDPAVHWLPEPFSGADLLQRVAAATAPA